MTYYRSLLFAYCFLSSFISLVVLTHGAGSIVFDTYGRSLYGFDIFVTTIDPSSSSQAELQVTDGVSVNYNGYFPSSPSSLLSLLNYSCSSQENHIDALVYVTERRGYSTIYLDLFPSLSSPSNRREILELPPRLHFPVLSLLDGRSSVSVKDRPSLSGDSLIFVSTHEPSPYPRQSWAAVYSTHLSTGATTRLTPNGIADFSPAVSPSGRWTAVASSGERGWSGEIQELNTDIYLFKTSDGSARTLVVEHGGWPCWADEFTLYFHRESSDQWWSVYKASIMIQGDAPVLISIDRITPPGFHAFTPAVSPAAPELIAVATRRASSQFRHIELIDLRDGRNAYVEVTRLTTPTAHHFNPFFSPEAGKIGYHRCRGSRNSGNPPLFLENMKSIVPDKFSLLRINGAFPSFSPDGRKIAYVSLPGVYVVNADGSNPLEIYSGNAFGTAWDWKRNGVIYTSLGPQFAQESTEVDIISITLSEDDDKSEPPLIKKLTSGGKNNAFPSPSPDGKWVVFRSGRSGYKNLYIMDSIEGESAGIYRLTEGPWSDTMCNWSPNGDWIAFASDRDNPGSGSFSIYMIHPNGTGLRKVVQSGNGGRTNHPWFSPDSASLVFTSDYAGVSAEPISNPHHFQPYGEIFTVKIDGTEIRRLTHDSYEDGTPTWTSSFLKPSDVAESLQGVAFCRFDDCHWLSLQNQINDVLNGTICQVI
ncbi:uncharacterized protein LOC110100298 isoform X2 [Dendrobium catenatum]|uniref:Protein TolB n=1 Tax=Dendrobium catenatum TaxID=906689 RepID=A0A2I0XCL4_9ASPA|nr:uncharacterized protein LOC110100298 isoform X1 [Dendrobium catenatum]XP_020683397.1 uncharacterized protein LOC110100298 isoform X2 [Dendrobium catenatum]PKU85650.1 hypothetical protein MA16_Dca003391 [Dendrobium catenatum]